MLPTFWIFIVRIMFPCWKEREKSQLEDVVMPFHVLYGIVLLHVYDDIDV